ncbi:MAG: hypothetical protein EZS28_051962, partial [Streblomastix strix]
ALAERDRERIEKDRLQIELNRERIEKDRFQSDNERALAERDRERIEKDRLQIELNRERIEKDRLQSDNERALAERDRERIEKERFKQERDQQKRRADKTQSEAIRLTVEVQRLSQSIQSVPPSLNPNMLIGIIPDKEYAYQQGPKIIHTDKWGSSTVAFNPIISSGIVRFGGFFEDPNYFPIFSISI